MPDDNPAETPQASLQTSKTQVVLARFFTTRNLSVIMAGTVLIIAMTRADSKDIPQIVATLANSKSSAVLGWSVATIILVVSVFLVRILSRIHDREIERLVKERDQLQQKLLNP
jgi:hypothetical protein